MFSKFCILAAAALVGVGSVASAQAGVVYDSISGNTPTGKYQILSGGGSGPLADSFTTGAQAVYLPSVTLELDLYTTNPGDLGSIQATLWSDTGNIPPGRNSLLASFASVADSSLTANAYSLVSVSSTQNITLAANTRYWVQLGSSSASSSWAYGPYSGVGVSGEYHWIASVGCACQFQHQRAIYDADFHLFIFVDIGAGAVVPAGARTGLGRFGGGSPEGDCRLSPRSIDWVGLSERRRDVRLKTFAASAWSRWRVACPAIRTSPLLHQRLGFPGMPH